MTDDQREMAAEPTHPTYGTLEELLEAIASAVRRGEHPRIGHQGALSWFAERYGALRSAQSRDEDDDA